MRVEDRGALHSMKRRNCARVPRNVPHVRHTTGALSSAVLRYVTDWRRHLGQANSSDIRPLQHSLANRNAYDGQPCCTAINKQLERSFHIGYNDNSDRRSYRLARRCIALTEQQNFRDSRCSGEAVQAPSETHGAQGDCSALAMT
jgi:hypothetical protein